MQKENSCSDGTIIIKKHSLYLSVSVSLYTYLVSFQNTQKLTL